MRASVGCGHRGSGTAWPPARSLFDADPRYAARVFARIAHGIGSPAYESGEWRDHPTWNRHADVPFRALFDLALAAYEERRGG